MALTDELKTFPKAVPHPNYRKHKALLRRAIINAHQDLGPAQEWSELDDMVLDTVTNWLTDLDTRRKGSAA